MSIAAGLYYIFTQCDQYFAPLEFINLCKTIKLDGLIPNEDGQPLSRSYGLSQLCCCFSDDAFDPL